MSAFSEILTKFRKFRFFLGTRVWFLFKISILIGFFWFLVESSFIFILQAFLVAIGLVEPKNTFIQGARPDSVVGPVLLLLAFGILRSSALMLRQYFTEMTNQVFLRTQRERILGLALAEAADVSTPEILNVFNERIPIAAAVVQNLSGAANTLMACACFFVFGLRLAPLELVLGLLLMLSLSLSLRFINSKINAAGKNLSVETQKLTRTLVMGLRNHFLLKIYGMTASEIDKGRISAAAYEGHYRRYILLASAKSAFPQLAGSLVLSLVCFISLWLIHTPGAKLISFIYIFMRLAQGLSETNAIIASVRFNFESFKYLYAWHLRGEKFLIENRRAAFSKVDTPSVEPPFTVKLVDLGFRYPGGDELFTGLSMEIKPKDVLLLKGRSGSGKSTLLNLILGLRTPTSGMVQINGVNAVLAINKISDHIGYVGPEPYIIEGTVRENLLYGNNALHISSEAMWSALECAQLGDWVKGEKQGLDRVLREVTELSTGQKQRLSLARAILRRPSLLILDEATANLDPRTEAQIADVISKLPGDITIIVVSHKNAFDGIASSVVDLDNLKSR
jgi:ATP-binding cassette subfamily C protein